MAISYKNIPPMKECSVVIIFSDVERFEDITFYGNECNQPHLLELKKNMGYSSLGKIKTSGKKAKGEQQFVVLFCLDGNKTKDHLEKCVMHLSKLPIKKAYISYKNMECAEWVVVLQKTTKINFNVFEVVEEQHTPNEIVSEVDTPNEIVSEVNTPNEIGGVGIDVSKIREQFKQEAEKIAGKKKKVVPPSTPHNPEPDVGIVEKSTTISVEGESTTSFEETPKSSSSTRGVVGSSSSRETIVHHPEDYDFYKWFFESMMKSPLFNRSDLECTYNAHITNQKKIKMLRETLSETIKLETDKISESDEMVEQKGEDLDDTTPHSDEDTTPQNDKDTTPHSDEDTIPPSWQTTSLVDYVLENTIEEYESFFDELVDNDALDEVSSFLQEEAKKYTIYPPMKDVFAALELCPLKSIKVVILGQNPYHTAGAAMGLAFSHNPDRKKVQPSLRNIYECLKHDGFAVESQNGDLSNWAVEGVLLLNTGLTVREGEPDSHLPKGRAKGPWSYFTESLLRHINSQVEHCVIILWGNPAKEYEKFFDSSKHHIIKAPHPAASIYKKKDEVDEFLIHKPFSRANDQLKKWKIEPVDWNL